MQKRNRIYYFCFIWDSIFVTSMLHSRRLANHTYLPQKSTNQCFCQKSASVFHIVPSEMLDDSVCTAKIQLLKIKREKGKYYAGAKCHRYERLSIRFYL